MQLFLVLLSFLLFSYMFLNLFTNTFFADSISNFASMVFSLNVSKELVLALPFSIILLFFMTVFFSSVEFSLHEHTHTHITIPSCASLVFDVHFDRVFISFLWYFRFETVDSMLWLLRYVFMSESVQKRTRFLWPNIFYFSCDSILFIFMAKQIALKLTVLFSFNFLWIFDCLFFHPCEK